LEKDAFNRIANQFFFVCITTDLPRRARARRVDTDKHGHESIRRWRRFPQNELFKRNLRQSVKSADKFFSSVFHPCKSAAKKIQGRPQLWPEAGVFLGIRYIETMNLQRGIFLGLVTAGWLSGRSLLADAVPGGNPYASIVERNVFGLVPIPVHNPADDVPAVPPPKIMPNGIMTLFGKLQVLFKVADNRPGQPPKEDSYVMSEGDRQDDIEVQKIDEKSATITFNNHGVVQELPLVASRASGGAGLASAPRMPVPGMAPANGYHPPIGFGGRFGGRNRNVTSGGNPNADDAPATPVPRAQEQISPEAQVIMMEANRIQTQEAVNQGLMPPLPPTVMTPADATGVGGGPLVAQPPSPPGE
jgi:hypothetical protein